MYEKYSRASVGLHQMYIAEIISVACLILAFVPLINIFAVIGALVASIMILVGLSKLTKVHEQYNTAFILLIVNIVVSIINSFAGGWFSALLDIVGSVLNLFSAYCIIDATNSLLAELGNQNIADKGCQLKKLYIAVCAVSVAGTLVSALFTFLATILSIVGTILSIIVLVLYIPYLKNSSELFQDAGRM